MISTKMTTATFAPGERASVDRSQSSTKAKADDAQAFKKAYGDKSLGEVLNKIADQSYVDPSKVQKERANEMDKNAFFKMMLAQIKNQDPTSPLPSHEMAAHLAQFSSLEQMYNVNENLKNMYNIQKPGMDYQALNFIGKNIAADTSSITRNKGDKVHELRFSLPQDVEELNLQIFNEKGDVVRTYKVGQLNKGDNKISWNGLDERNLPVKPGEYKFTLDAKNSRGVKVMVDTAVNGRITGVNFTNKGPVLMIGDQTINLADVKKIEDQSIKMDVTGQEKSLTDAQNKDSEKVRVLANPKIPTEEGNLDEISMDNKLKKRVTKGKES